ncbi:PREDICTED: uncharacterized protein LOC107169623 [Diuraphis noxia]|uniref:uncharacterized protein LOC107169623 n=1 Tax=Diuraphis noxia TaxID=143948 RepID=UPI0007639ADB|nr:PREDICTED: uncharacterized protein LOC107169623 [Diuraphis noxia]
MTTITLIAALLGCLLIHPSVLTSTAARVPNSDLPFEFNLDKGSVITEDNILTQSVSSDGQNVIKTNKPQPIIHYQSDNKDKNKSSKQQNKNKKQQIENNAANGATKYPTEHSSVSYYSNNPIMDQFRFFENLSKYFPGIANTRIQYI